MDNQINPTGFSPVNTTKNIKAILTVIFTISQQNNTCNMI